MQPEFRVVVAGTRTFDDYDLLCRKLDGMLRVKRDTHRIVILSGGAKGADALGERYARERGYGLQVYPADWNAHGKAAGPMRNTAMVKYANAAVFFWDLASDGTRDCLKKARERKIPIRVVCYTLEPQLLELSDEVIEEYAAMKRRIYDQVEAKA